MLLRNDVQVEKSYLCCSLVGIKDEGLWFLVYQVFDMEEGIKYLKALGMRQITEIKVGKSIK